MQDLLLQIWQKLRKVESIIGADKAAIVWDAVKFAESAHAGQERVGGEPYICHVWRVTLAAMEELLKDSSLGADFLIATPLHDVVEDCGVTIEELRQRFSEEAATLVFHLSHEYEEEPEEVYLNRVKAGGYRAIRIKRLDKLDNIRSLSQATPEFRQEKLAELPEFLNLWNKFDPEGAEIIEQAASELNN